MTPTASPGKWKDDGPDGHPAGQIAAISIAALVTVGDSDPLLSVVDANEARWRMENASFLAIPGAKHPAHEEREDLFLPALDAFLAP